MTCTPRAGSPKSPALSPPSLPDGRIGESLPFAKEITMRRRSGWSGRETWLRRNDQIYDLLGILESQRGNSAQAIANLRKAAELNPQNLRAIYQLAEETERQGEETAKPNFSN